MALVFTSWTSCTDTSTSISYSPNWTSETTMKQSAPAWVFLEAIRQAVVERGAIYDDDDNILDSTDGENIVTTPFPGHQLLAWQIGSPLSFPDQIGIAFHIDKSIEFMLAAYGNMAWADYTDNGGNWEGVSNTYTIPEFRTISQLQAVVGVTWIDARSQLGGSTFYGPLDPDFNPVKWARNKYLFLDALRYTKHLEVPANTSSYARRYYFGPVEGTASKANKALFFDGDGKTWADAEAAFNALPWTRRVPSRSDWYTATLQNTVWKSGRYFQIYMDWFDAEAKGFPTDFSHKVDWYRKYSGNSNPDFGGATFGTYHKIYTSPVSNDESHSGFTLGYYSDTSTQPEPAAESTNAWYLTAGTAPYDGFVIVKWDVSGGFTFVT